MPHSSSDTLRHRALLLMPILVLLLTACQSRPESVVTQPASTPATSPLPMATAAASPVPAEASAQRQDPFGSLSAPGGTTTAASQNPRTGTGSGNNITGMPGVTTRPYKPTPTPGDPFPPRPTPTLVVKDGKPVQDWQAPPEALTLTNPVNNRPDAARIGEGFYSQRCADCHGKRGYGNGPMSKGIKKLPTNLASKMVQSNTDGELFWKITNGRSPMPASRVRFEDEQRWYIVSFLRTLK